MIIVYGRNRFTKLQGYVADYCKTCRRVTEFKVEEVVMAPHVYFIRIGPGSFLGNVQTCNSCKMESDAYTNRFKSISKKRIASVDQLAQETFPTVYEVFKARLEREARLRMDSETFDATERQKAFLEIFKAASVYFQNRQRLNGLRVLVNGLNPLNSTEEELRECLSHFRDGRHAIGTLRSAELLSMVQRKELSSDRY